MNNPPTVRLIGLGALGILYGQKLNAGLPHGNFKVIADPARAARYQQEGVSLNGEACNFLYESPKDGQPVDWVLVAVKATGLGQALADAAPFVGENTVVFSVLNGISSEEMMAEQYGAEKVLYAVAQGMDATRNGQHLRSGHQGTLLLGEKNGQQTERLHAIGQMLAQCGIAHQLCDDILHRQWSKLMFNVGINQATALYETTYGGVKQPCEARSTMLAAMAEVIPLAKLAGVELTQADWDGWLRVAETMADDGMTSMRQDMLAHRKTEIDLFAGTILRLAEAAGLDAPVNRDIYNKIKAREATF